MSDHTEDELGAEISRMLGRMGAMVRSDGQALLRHRLLHESSSLTGRRRRPRRRSVVLGIAAASLATGIMVPLLRHGHDRRDTIVPATAPTNDPAITDAAQATTAQPITEETGRISPTSEPAEISEAVQVLPPAPIAGRSGPLAVWTGSEMIVFGGIDLTNGYRGLNDGAAYRPSTGTWRKIATAPVDFGGEGVAVWTGTEMFVAGGRSDSEQPAAVALYNPETDTWLSLIHI